MANRSGQQLGNYRLLRLLGQGSFAEVYLGEHIYLQTQAAIKVLHGQMMQDDIENFKREARITFPLRHPHILRVLDFGFADKMPFFVMDYVASGTLRERYPRGSIMPMSRLLTYVKQIGAALQYAHDHRLIHRDVKPENMLLANEETVILSDFGFVTLAHNTSSMQIQTAVGTLQYMAPEQIQGQPRPASDQYALAVTVYEWLCGERPFKGNSVGKIMQSQMLHAPPSLCEKVATILPDVERVVLTGLAKEPQRRFASVQAFVNALEQAFKEDKGIA